MDNLLSKLIPYLSHREYVDSLAVLWESLLYFQWSPKRLDYLVAFDFFLNCLFGCIRSLQLQHTGLVASWHVDSQLPDHVPCTGRQILNHWTTREVLLAIDFNSQGY